MTTTQSQPTNTPAWHAMPVAEVLSAQQVTEQGLESGEASKRLAEVGPNRLPSPPKQHPILRFFAHFHNLLIYVLLVSAIITSALGHFTDTLVILTVVVVNAIIGFVQEGKAEKAMDAIRVMLAMRAAVLRVGRRQTVAGDDLVPGDVVLLEAGDKVPADLRLLWANGLQVQEAILTGESVPAQKQTDAVSKDAPVGDRSCMVYSGTLVTSGLARGVVVATGGDTEIGRISGMLSMVELLTTPLLKQMDVFARWLTILILLIAGVLLIFGSVIGNYAFTELFIAVVGLSVAAIPEGLPAVLTITLAVGVQAMAKRNAIVRRLPAIETIGSVSVICTDKTGTLTRNEMMVAMVVTNEHQFTLDGIGYTPSGGLWLNQSSVDGNEYQTLQLLGRVAALCNDAAIHEHAGEWHVEGDPMEGALLAFAGKVGVDAVAEASRWRRTDLIPFDAKHRFMATLNHDHDNHACVYLKGAPEHVMELCEQQFSGTDTAQTIDREYWHQQAERITSQGLRALAIAIKPSVPEHTVLEFSDVGEGLILVGLVGLMDPPRAEVIDAIAECQQAGIRVKMITGDHKGTAMAIAKAIGLQNPLKVLTGAQIDTLSDHALSHAILDTDIFARTSPEHKMRLVKALQAHDLTVAMTGDGVNDAPALKRADAGIVMGMKGSEAAKEAAELVLVDDNFTSIVSAVREGRTVYDNIKKVISWTLPTNAGEAMTIIVALVFGMTLPITPIQILWVNLITAVTLGIALAFEPTDSHTMKRPPRQRGEALVSGELVWHILFASLLMLAGVFGVYTYAVNQGYSLELSRSMAVNTLVVLEIFQLFFIRNMHNTSISWQSLKGTKMVWLTVGAVTMAQFAMTYLPLMQGVFSTQSIGLKDGLVIVGIGVLFFALIETEKRLRLAVKAMRTK